MNKKSQIILGDGSTLMSVGSNISRDLVGIRFFRSNEKFKVGDSVKINKNDSNLVFQLLSSNTESLKTLRNTLDRAIKKSEELDKEREKRPIGV